MNEYEIYRKHIELRGAHKTVCDYLDETDKLRALISQHSHLHVPVDKVIYKLVDVKILIDHLRAIYDKSDEFDVSSGMYVDKFEHIRMLVDEKPPLSYLVM